MFVTYPTVYESSKTPDHHQLYRAVELKMEAYSLAWEPKAMNKSHTKSAAQPGAKSLCLW